MTRFLGSPKVQYFKTSTTEYLIGGRVYSYEAGTLTPKATYSTVADALAGTNANTNPVILDTRGEAVIVIKGNTKIVLKDSNDVEIWSVDNLETGDNTVYDTSGNELLKFTEVVNAVNEITVSNAQTGSSPSITSTGSDSIVGLTIATKSTGSLNLSSGGGLNMSSGGNLVVTSTNLNLSSTSMSVDLTSSLKIPVGTTAQQPVTPLAGMMRYDSTHNAISHYNGTDWTLPSAISAVRTSTGSVAHNTNVLIPYTSTTFDILTELSSNIFTPTIAGYYLCLGYVLWSTPVASGQFSVRLFKNGSQYSESIRYIRTTDSAHGVEISDIIFVNGTTDTLALYAFQNSGVSEDFPLARFSAIRLSS